MRLLSGHEISDILRGLSRENATHLLDTLTEGLASFSAEQNNKQDASIHQPLRSSIQTRDRNTVLIMPVSNTSTTSVKVVTVPNKGDIQGAITVYSAAGELLGVVNAAEITAFRTALAIMTLMVRWKAPSSPKMIVFGAGKQSEWHIRLALLLIDGVKSVTIVNRSRQRLEKFDTGVISVLKNTYPDVTFESISPGGNAEYRSQMTEKLADADIICCCTPSTEPLFTANDLQGSSSRPKFLSMIGAYKPEMQEVDTETMRMGQKIYVDSKDACLEESGELIRAKMGPEDLIEVGDLFSKSKKSESLAHQDLTIYKCVGMGLMDLIISQALLEIAQSLKVGTLLDNF